MAIATTIAPRRYERPKLTLAELAVIFYKYPTAFLECRGWGHEWKRRRRGAALFDTGRSVHGVEFLQLDLPCQSCGTVRHDRFVKVRGRWTTPDDPASLGAVYSYADGFLLAADLIEGGAPTRPETREFVINREAGII